METPLTSIKNSLARKLDPVPHWKKMMPEGYPLDLDYSEESYKHASVLISIYKDNDQYYFPLIQRTIDGHAHSGQISLPGGRVESGESFEHAAIREAHEEIGVDPSEVQILGQLSSFPLHVSNYLVHPFVGVTDKIPNWVIQESEVQNIILVNIQDLKKHVHYTEMFLRGSTERVPYFDIEKQVVWGATAMILSEFSSLY